MALVRYSAYPLSNLQNQVNRMFDQFDQGFEHSSLNEGLGGGMFRPAVDVREDADAYTIHVEVPGIAQENLDISMQQNTLLIRGRKEQKSDSSEGQFRRVERSYGSFSRALSLPRNVDGARVSANLNDGVLEIRLPKSEESKPRQISIGTTSDALPQIHGAPSNSASSHGAPASSEELPINQTSEAEAAEPEGHPT